MAILVGEDGRIKGYHATKGRWTRARREGGKGVEWDKVVDTMWKGMDGSQEEMLAIRRDVRKIQGSHRGKKNGTARSRL